MSAPDPVAFTIFGFDIRWYGILIAAGFVLAILISCVRAPAHGIKDDTVLDLAIWMIPFSIIGARAYYVLFNWYEYKGSIRSVLDIRAGGLAIHGGLIAGLIVAYFVCRYKKVSFLEMADLVFPSVALAQSIGRWGNFFNSEAHGGPTDLPWAIVVNGQHVHPTFLYESLWCFALFWFLLWLDLRRKFRGQVALMYGMLYSLERFGVEHLRTDSLMIGSLKQAQVLSAVVFIACLAGYVYLDKKYLDKGAADDPVK